MKKKRDNNFDIYEHKDWITGGGRVVPPKPRSGYIQKSDVPCINFDSRPSISK